MRLAKHLKRFWRRIALSLLPLVLALLHTLGAVPIGLLDRLDAIFYDARMRLTMPQTADDRIVIVDIDEKSLAEIGRWPWSRNKMAALTDALFTQQQIAILGFDVVFAEADESSGVQHLTQLAQQELKGDAAFVQQLDKIAPLLDYDGAFARSIAQRPVVLGYYFTSDRMGRTSGVLPAPVMSTETFANQPVPFTQWSGFGANIDVLAAAAPLAGFFNSITEVDGVVRALPLVVRYDGQYYESLSLALFRRLVGMPTVKPGFAANALHSVVLQWPDKRYSIPVDERVAMLVPYRGNGGVNGGSFRYISASDVLAGRLPAGSLSNKIVLLGTTAPGIVDLRSTPVNSVYPGIEVHANVLSSLLDRRFLVRPANATGYEALLLLLLGLSLTLVLPLLRAPVAVSLGAGVTAALVGLNWWLYAAYSLVLALAPLLFLAVGVFALNISYGYLVASRSRRELVRMFGTYVPPELVLEMVKNPDNYSMRAKSDELTVMFCDLRGFTQMSEQMDPLELQRLLNTIFSELTHVIGANRGTVDKYMGDCVMAFWGAPVESPTHGQLAVKTALQMAQAIERINQTFQHDGARAHAGLTIDVGIGINTGMMYVGDMGSDIRRSYTVVGDAVNLASRLEGLSKVYGVSIVVSESTRQLATNLRWQELDRVRVKGKAQAITIYTPWLAGAAATPVDTDTLTQWQDFLDSYRAQDWRKCDSLMQTLVQSGDSTLYQLYRGRVAQYRTTAFDPAWDSTTNFESK